MTGFFTKAAQRGGGDFAQDAEKVLRAMGLPEPQDGEFLDGAEAQQIFLDDYGLVVRAGRRMEAPEHSLILAPLRATAPHPYKRHEHLIEIMPGVLPRAVSDLEIRDLRNSLRRDRIRYRDVQYANCGYLPHRTKEFPNGIPVVIDRGAVDMKLPRLSLKEKFRHVSYPGTQHGLYAPLLKKLEKTWPEGSSLPLRPMRSFMTACRSETAKKGGLLCNDWSGSAAPWTNVDWWDEESPDSWNLTDKPAFAARAGAAYAGRLRGNTGGGAKP
jgi:hypothetical protein